jgi:E1A-binding protein p400
VQAAKCAKAEAVAELDEFDENIPIVEENKEPELSKAEKEVQIIMEQV